MVNFFCSTNKRSIFSVKKKENKYSYFKIRNFVKLANHRMTYQEHYSKSVILVLKKFHNQTDTYKTKTFWNHSFSPKGFHGLRNKTFMCHSELKQLKLRRESKKVGETVTVMVFPAPKASWLQCSQNLFEIARILLP